MLSDSFDKKEKKNMRRMSMGLQSFFFYGPLLPQNLLHIIGSSQ